MLVCLGLMFSGCLTNEVCVLDITSKFYFRRLVFCVLGFCVLCFWDDFDLG